MDFSFLDREEYKDILLLDEPTNKQFYIVKYKKKDRNTVMHRHKYFQINYVYKGSGKHIINNKSIDIYKGDVFVIPPYVPHEIVADENKNLEIIEFEFSTDFILSENYVKDEQESYLDFAYLEPFIVVEENVKPSFNLSGEIQDEVESILNEALEEFDEKAAGYILIIKALLLKLLVIIGRAFTFEIKGTDYEKILNKYKNMVAESTEYIKENYNKNITLKEVAHKALYSSSRFSYLFKSVTGQTFVEYVTGIRINKAIELLKNSDKSITDISYAVGFNTLSNFNKAFKAFTGKTPKAYRKG